MSRGHDRERMVRELLELGFTPEIEPPSLWEEPELTPWFVIRTAGSFGPVDLVAMRPGRVLFVQVKSDGIDYGPFNNFPPAARAAIQDAAIRAGAEAWLVWVPPSPPGVRGVHGAWIPEMEWPQ